MLLPGGCLLAAPAGGRLFLFGLAGPAIDGFDQSIGNACRAVGIMDKNQWRINIAEQSCIAEQAPIKRARAGP